MKEVKSQCVSRTNQDCLYLNKKQSALLTAMLLGIFIIVAIVSYVAGYKAAVSVHIQEIHKSSLADEIFANVHGGMYTVDNQQEQS
jgi:hypothetical protein